MRALRFSSLSSVAGAALAAAAAIGACGGVAFTAASGSDAGAVSDASVDAGGGEASGAGFCASLPDKHYFCDDFDDGTLNAGWDTQAASRFGNALFDTAEVKSPPRALEVETTHSVSSEETSALLQKDIGTLKSLVMELDVLVDTYGGDPGRPDLDYCLLIGVGLGDLSYNLVTTGPANMIFRESATPDGGAPEQFGHSLDAGLPPGKWVHAKIALTLPELEVVGHVVIVFDGQTVLDTPLTIASTQSASALLTLGLYLKNAPNLWKIHYDNVVVDKQ